MNLKPIALAASMFLTTAAWADGSTADTTAPAPVDAPPAMSLDMPMPANDAAADSLQKMDANLDKMRDALAKMKDAKDPAERQTLMQDYLTAQHENMMLAHTGLGLGGPGMNMAGPGMGHGMGMMGKNDCDRDDMRGMGMMEHRRGSSPCEDKKRDDACDRGGKGGGMGMMGGMDMSGKGGGMGMMGMMGGKGGGMGGMMGGMKDDATAARIESLEKRLDMLQEMMKMMMGH